MSEKKRLDVLLYERGLAQSREKARALIMAGDVLVDDERCDKAGASVAVDAVIRLKAGTQMKYVSRGGLKREKAMHLYGLKLDAVSYTHLDVYKRQGQSLTVWHRHTAAHYGQNHRWRG